MPVEKVTLRFEPKSDTFEVHFRLNVKELQLVREFNLNRRPSESVEILMARIKANMEKAFGRKLKKTKSKLNIEKGSAQEKKLVQITADLRKDGKPVPMDITCEQLFFSGNIDPESIKFVFCGQQFGITVNLPYVNKISLPSVAMEGLPLYPLKFVMKFGQKENSVFHWFREDSEKQWTLTGEGFAYYPTKTDVGKLLKVEVTPSNVHCTGETVSAVMDKPVSPSVGNLPYKRRHQHTNDVTEYPNFRVMSYNILADKYAETEEANTKLFPYCPGHARSWQYRRGMIVDEIIGYKSHIICLQEVDTRVFEYDLTAFLKTQYKGIFNKKYSVEEGVAIFFDRNRYKLLSNSCCYLGMEVDTNELFQDIWDKVKNIDGLAERLRGLGTVAQAVILSDMSSPDKITVVGNTHLYFHPDADHIRLLQGGIFARFLSDVVTKIRLERPCSSVALVVCGDMNSVPSCGIYSLFTKGFTGADCPDWKSKHGEHVTDLELRQPFDMSSAYGTPKYTNFTKEFADCLDYIYYQKDKLKLTSTVPLLSEEELAANTALPSVVCPSDHLALIADLSWSKSNSVKPRSPEPK